MRALELLQNVKDEVFISIYLPNGDIEYNGTLGEAPYLLLKSEVSSLKFRPECEINLNTNSKKEAIDLGITKKYNYRH